MTIADIGHDLFTESLLGAAKILESAAEDIRREVAQTSSDRTIRGHVKAVTRIQRLVLVAWTGAQHNIGNATDGAMEVEK